MTLAWSLFLLYVVGTFWLARLGQRKTTSLRDFALGDGHMHPLVVGLALAASMTSTATFVINPGIVWAYGMSAVFGYGLAAGAGLMVGIVVLSKGFRRYGTREAILTVPDWIGRRYDDRRLTVFYALVNLLLLAMVVLVCYAMAGLLQAVLGFERLFGAWSFEVALSVTVAFVFSYVFVGGTFAHAYTNTLQGGIMLVVAVVLIASGLPLPEEGLLEGLRAVDPQLATPVNPNSLLFRNLFEVFGVNLLIGFALALQPHFLIKVLYVDSERAVNRYLAIALGAGVVFNLVLLVGLWARLDQSGAVDAAIAAQGLGIDGVVPAYLVATFSPPVAVVVSIALLAAGMSTLDGILVALSVIFANDLYLNLRRGRPLDPGELAAAAFRVGRYSLIGFGVVAFVLALVQHHTKTLSIALFAQEGVYALLIANFVPLLFGLFRRPLPKGVVLASSIAALGVHFTFRYAKLTVLTAADYTNPGLTATYGLLVALAIAVPAAFWGRRTLDQPPASSASIAKSDSL